MFRRISTLLLCLSFITTLFASQDDVFLSLTRKAEPLRDLPTNVSVITSDQIKAKSARDLGEVLENEVGLQVSKNGTLGQASNAFLRGSTSEETLVLVDGRRVNNIAMGQTDLNTIPADRIERVEIIRGAASAIYGTGAFGGVINVITKKPQDNKPILGFNASAGSFGTKDYQVDFGIKRDRTYGLVSAARKTLDGWRKNSDAANSDFFARLGYDAQDLGKFDLSASTIRSEIGAPGTAFTDPSDPFSSLLGPKDFNGSLERQTLYPNARQKDAHDYLRLEHSKSMGVYNFKTSVYTSQDTINFRDPDPSPFWPNYPTDSENRSMVFGGETQADMKYGLTAGLEWWQEQYRQTDNLGYVNDVDRSRVTTALYLQDELKAGAFSFIPSIRFDENSEFGSVFSPRTSVVFRASENLKLSGNVGKIWRAPTFNELYYPLDSYLMHGNPDLQPEEGISSDIGIEYSRESLRAALTLFNTDTDNLIVWEYFPATFETYSVNVNKSRQTGAEVTVSQKLAPGIFGRVNYTYLWAEGTNIYGTDPNKIVELNYRPRNTANAGITCVTPFGTQVDADLQYIGSQLTWSASTPELPSAMLLGVGVRQKISDLDIWVRGQNLLDTRYETRLGYPLPGMTVLAGLTYRLWE